MNAMPHTQYRRARVQPAPCLRRAPTLHAKYSKPGAHVPAQRLITDVGVLTCTVSFIGHLRFYRIVRHRCMLRKLDVDDGDDAIGD